MIYNLIRFEQAGLLYQEVDDRGVVLCYRNDKGEEVTTVLGDGSEFVESTNAPWIQSEQSETENQD